MESGIFGTLGSDKYEEYCRDIHSSGEYLLSVINDILDMSRIEAGRVSLTKQPVPVNAPSPGRCASSTSRSAPRTSPSPSTWRRRTSRAADERALHQILVNLLQNATKFTSDGGCITVRTRLARDAVNLYVEDNGIGIPEHALQKLGRPFEQVETEFSKSYKGSGLGLAIARSLAELHGGTLRIRSQEGVGTIVLVHLPTTQSSSSDIALADAAAA
jgi:two-component system cell cycle sensor histidine kinase PleC